MCCLVASYRGAENISDFKPGKSPLTLDTLIHKSKKDFEFQIGQNNGIRTHNVLSLLSRVGLSEQEIDTVWLGTIDAFGADRGQVAHHTGVKGHVSYQTNPMDLLARSNDILQGFEKIDTALERLR